MPDPGDIVDQQLGDPAPVSRQLLEMLLDQRGLIDKTGQRRAQFVRDIGHEPPFTSPGLLERFGHTVEGVCPGAELVTGGYVEADREIAVGHLEGGFTGLTYRPENLLGNPIAGGGPDHDEDECTG